MLHILQTVGKEDTNYGNSRLAREDWNIKLAVQGYYSWMFFFVIKRDACLFTECKDLPSAKLIL